MRRPHKCPVCEGDGKRWPNFEKKRANKTPPVCPACSGTGMVWDFASAPTYVPYSPPYYPWPYQQWPWWQYGTVCNGTEKIGGGGMSVSIDTTGPTDTGWISSIDTRKCEASNA